MFKQYKDLCDVVSLLIYCPSERSFLFTKESSGELWLPTLKCEKNCWKSTAVRIITELFGSDPALSQQCSVIRISKLWLPNHVLNCVYHAVYTINIKSDVKKKLKLKSVVKIGPSEYTRSVQGIRIRLQWYNNTELERHRAHANLRSPELAAYAAMVAGIDQVKDADLQEMDYCTLVELSEEHLMVGSDVGAGAVSMATSSLQLLQAAGYKRDDQLRLYREFVMLSFPCLYMSCSIFTTFMTDIGWQRPQCLALFRAADVTGRGGLTFTELMLWCAALEPTTQHSGMSAEIRCRYIFRYFDSNRDMKLEYVEFKELVAAARAARQLPVDALSVARDADVCLRYLYLYFLLTVLLLLL